MIPNNSFLAKCGLVLLLVVVASYLIFFYRNVSISSRMEPIYNVRNVFIDLGANKGDSVLNFFGINQMAQGGNLNEIYSILSKANPRWIVHAFEANKYFDDKLDETKKKIESLGHTVYLYKQTAAWIYDGTIEFYLDTVNKNVDYWGSSLNSNHPDVRKSNQTKTKVKCVDIAGLIKQYEEKDNVILKVDIEGAEFKLILDLIKKDSIKLVDYAAVEFHDGLSTHQRPRDVYIDLVKLFNVKFLSWSK